MPLATFPAFVGLAWEIKKRVLFSNSREVSASGVEFTNVRWSLPHYEFDLDWNYLTQADRDAFEAFFLTTYGGASPFLLSVTNDSVKTGAALTPAPDGINKTFQIAMPAQTNIVGTPTVKDNGVAAAANTATATGAVTFTTAPVAAHTLTADFTYAYVVRFKDDKLEFNQMMHRFYECKKMTFRTVR